jgi:hypothetical protein
VPADLRHVGGGHRAEVGGALVVLGDAVLWLLAIIVDTHRSRV